MSTTYPSTDLTSASYPFPRNQITRTLARSNPLKLADLEILRDSNTPTFSTSFRFRGHSHKISSMVFPQWKSNLLNHPQSQDAVKSNHGSNTLCLMSKCRLDDIINYHPGVKILPQIMIDEATEQNCDVRE